MLPDSCRCWKAEEPELESEPELVARSLKTKNEKREAMTLSPKLNFGQLN